MDRSTIWHDVVSLLADHSPMAVWRTTEAQPEFWWAISLSDDVRPDHVVGSLNRDDPLFYRDIMSVLILRDFRGVGEVFACDWAALKDQLCRIQGVRMRELHGVLVSLDEPRYEAVELTVDDGCG